jgi:hypothetical protein
MSTTTSLSSSSPATMSSIPLAITIRLNKNNYILWLVKLLLFLRSTKLMAYFDGTLPAPAKMITSSMEVGAEHVAKPAYARWYNQDQQLLSRLLSSITEDVLQDVVTATTPKEAWDTLHQMFSSSIQARIVHIRVELVMTKKHGLMAVYYYRKIIGLANELATANAPMKDDEVIAYHLAVFLAEYNSFVTSMTTKN